jgi:hypothetical protein
MLVVVLAESRGVDRSACLLLEVAREGVSGTSSVVFTASASVVSLEMAVAALWSARSERRAVFCT